MNVKKQLHAIHDTHISQSVSQSKKKTKIEKQKHQHLRFYPKNKQKLKFYFFPKLTPKNAQLTWNAVGLFNLFREWISSLIFITVKNGRFTPKLLMNLIQIHTKIGSKFAISTPKDQPQCSCLWGDLEKPHISMQMLEKLPKFQKILYKKSKFLRNFWF